MKTEIATFGAGCFWHIESSFENSEGVVKTQVGYTGGKMKNPTYQNVCSGETGHVEAIEVKFDSEKVKYEELLNLFWKIHNPTTKNRQGFDIGRQYNSVIFYHNNEQKKLAEKSKKEIQKLTDKKIVTKIKKVGKFWPAEEYHQKYFKKNKK